MADESQPEPSRLCMCGCGEKAPLSTVTRRPTRYVRGHGTRRPRTWTIDPDTGCWNWDGGVLRGRGLLFVGGRQVYAYRHVYEQTHGPLAEDIRLHHRCENKLCVNPAHLEPMTQSEHLKLHWQQWKAAA
jgi:hypothetical protein